MWNITWSPKASLAFSTFPVKGNKGYLIVRISHNFKTLWGWDRWLRHTWEWSIWSWRTPWGEPSINRRAPIKPTRTSTRLSSCSVILTIWKGHNRLARLVLKHLVGAFQFSSIIKQSSGNQASTTKWITKCKYQVTHGIRTSWDHPPQIHLLA